VGRNVTPPGGINGPIDDLLFPIDYGIPYYPGYDVLPPFVAYKVGRLDEVDFEQVAEQLRERIQSIYTWHYQINPNGGPRPTMMCTTSTLLHPNQSGAGLVRDRHSVVVETRDPLSGHRSDGGTRDQQIENLRLDRDIQG